MFFRCWFIFGWIFCLSLPLTAQSFEQGVVYFEAGEFALAQEIFHQLEQTQKPEVFFYLGRLAFENENYDQSIEYFEEATDLDKKNTTYHMWLGHSFGRQAQNANRLRQAGLARNSRKNYETAIDLDPTNVEARESAIEFYLQAPGFLGGGRDKAEAQARALENLNTEAGIRAWGRIFTYYDEPAFAEAHYLAAIESHPQLMLSYNQLYNFYFNEQAFEKAVNIVELQLAVNDSTAYIYHNLGNAQQRYGLFDEALEAYKSALQQDETFYTTWYQIGRLAAVSGNHLEIGKTYLTRFIALGDEINTLTKAWAYFRLGTIHEHLDENAEAKSAYTQALKWDNTHAEARTALEALD